MTVVRKENKDNVLVVKFCGANDVHHGQCENDVLGKSWRSKEGLLILKIETVAIFSTLCSFSRSSNI